MTPTSEPTRPNAADDDTVLATLRPSAARRWMGVGALGILGALLLGLALAPEVAVLWRLALAAGAVLTARMAMTMERATRRGLVLTPGALREEGEGGEILARLSDVRRVDRSAFALKPSNGFVMLLADPVPRAYRPGLWWRIGRRVAVGGVLSGSETRGLADSIAVMIADTGDGPRG
ncbi:hypothetical protein LVO79_03725 [Roseivivax marinus]|uniref:hypothetical protein n=1 Tax=Roseivivax marinus TaxID=1379903 RepID=UPI001F03D502|nr:hypothetical protein [Roseivivax marinus]UMA65585.1 hypothetical protein LVO79_03725 [Roseivivax marinus]